MFISYTLQGYTEPLNVHIRLRSIEVVFSLGYVSYYLVPVSL